MTSKTRREIAVGLGYVYDFENHLVHGNGITYT
jgi:hypothetical protein